MAAVDVTEGCTIDQILASDGFTFDTADMTEFMDDDESCDNEKATKMSNLEMFNLLNPNVNGNQVDFEMEFEALSFEDLKPKMHSIYEDNLILKLIKKPGVGDPVPPEAQVTVQYSGYFEHQNEPFDTSFFRREKYDVLRVGRGQMLPGLDFAIQSMKQNETSLFIIHPNLMYGKLGCPPRIPPDAEVLFKITLVNFLDNGSADKYDELTEEEKSKWTVVEKKIHDLLNTAKDNFNRHKYKVATKEYNRALHWIENASLQDDQEEEAMKKVLERTLRNLLICYNKIQKPKLVCATFNKLETPNAKAMFNYGKALKELGDYDKSLEMLQKAYELEPKSEEIYTEISKVAAIHKKYAEITNKFAKRALGKAATEELNDFQKDVKEMVTSFKESGLTKQELPAGLTRDEEEYFRKIAHGYGLNIATHIRFNKSCLFMIKPDFQG